MTEPLPLDTRRKSRRLHYTIAALVCVGAIAWMLVLVQKNVVFFKTVDQAVRDEPRDGTHSLRIGGSVDLHSISQRSDGVDFILSEGGASVRVHHTGSEPSLFKDCAPVVAEGHWRAPGSHTFDSTRLLIKHGNDYEAPKNAQGQCPKDPFRS